LAIVCAVVGFAFTVLQDMGDWVTYSDHSAGALGVYVGKGLGFDAVHAAGCLVFALAFGPALLRSITRFSTRLQVRWVAPGGVVAPVALVLASAAAGTGAWLASQAPSARAGASPTSYLLSAQNADGGLGNAPGQSSSALYSGWAALGLAAEGLNPQRVVKDGHSLAAYIESGGGGGSDPGSLERTILALRAAGLPVAAQLGALQGKIGSDGAVSGQTNLTAFAVLALRAAGVGPSPLTLGWLKRQQDGDGGFNFASAGGASDVDDTGAVLEALGGPDGRVTARAVGFIERQQGRDGGFPAQAGSESNAQSTAWAIQGLLAAGADGGSVARALAYLSSLIAPDGHVRYSRSSDQSPVWVTGEALMAIARKPLPLAPVPLPGSGGGSHARASAHARGTHQHHRARGRRSAVAPRNAASPASLRIASDLGVAAALALAPVGVG
jgi:energy-coupling factor transport system substrate-specific component